jgi:hypothetical protein
MADVVRRGACVCVLRPPRMQSMFRRQAREESVSLVWVPSRVLLIV